MASLTIPDIDAQLESRLIAQAARHGRSIEGEALDILRAALSTNVQSNQQSLIDSIRRRIAPLGGVDLDLPARR